MYILNTPKLYGKEMKLKVPASKVELITHPAIRWLFVILGIVSIIRLVIIVVGVS